jgi:hypothetical protein
MSAQDIMNEAKETGRVWLGGEMEFPFEITCGEAAHLAYQIANACGYLVRLQGSSRLAISGGDIIGEIVLDWFSPDATYPAKVEHWTCESAWRS